MRSHLTRRIFRRLISNQPVVRHRHLHYTSRPGILPRCGQSSSNAIPFRTFFGLFQKPVKDNERPRHDPGMDKMLELDRRLHLVARLPLRKELVLAFRAFVQSKLDRVRPIEDFQAFQLLQTLRSLEGHDDLREEKMPLGEDVSAGLELTVEDLRNALRALGGRYGEDYTYTTTHNELAKSIWIIILERRNKDALPEIPPYGLLSVLCATGDTAQAREALRAAKPIENGEVTLWSSIVAGFSKENNEVELLQTLKEVEDMGLKFDRTMRRVVALHYARDNNVTETKKWLTTDALRRMNESSGFGTKFILPNIATVWQEFFQFCLRNNEMAWGQSIIQTIPGREAKEETWNAIFLASATTGKSVDDIDRMLTVMARRSEQSGAGQGELRIHTFNGLIRLAVSREDPYTAERYFNLIGKWNMVPNAETYILQAKYRLAAGDIDGAVSSYSLLREQTIVDDEDWPIMNRLLQALTNRLEAPNEVIMGLVEDLSDRKRVFPADTVLSLCKYHLSRDEYFEVVDLLDTYAYQYSISQRIEIRDFLYKYTIDSSTDTGRAWDTYMIFHQVFDLESRRDVRNTVMSSFFNRGRPDLATHVFTRMSQHMRTDTRPDAETYAIAFEGIAKTSDAEALEVIHNLLKLDTETEPTTRIYNGLMLAYTACEMPLRALDFWDQIATSGEGPSYNSLHIAFRSCEKAPFGYQRARAIWKKLRQADIDITRDLFASYVGCLSGQALFDEVRHELEQMKEMTGSDVDFFTVGSVYNAAPGVVHQRRIEGWCEEHYPKIWQQVLDRGRNEDEMGIQHIEGLDRTVEA